MSYCHYKVKHWMLVIVAAIFAALLLVLGYLTFLDGKVINVPIEFNNDPLLIQTDKASYKRGEVVSGYLDYCKKRDIKTIVQWSMVDGILTIYPTREAYTSKGCRKVAFEIEKIPKNALVEPEVHFEGLLQYQVNPFSVVSFPLKTTNFEITP